MNKDLNSIIDKASIVYIDNKNELLLRSKFKLFNKFNFGVLLFLFTALSLIGFGILNRTDFIALSFYLVLGLPILVLSILTLFKQNSDFVKVTDTEIEFMNSLKKHKFGLDPEMKVKTKARTEFVKIRSSVFHFNKGSYFRITEIFLVLKNTEYRILDFQVDQKDARQANLLAVDIIQSIKQRIRSSKKH